MADEKKDNAEMYYGERGERFMKLYMTIQRRLYGYAISLIPDAGAVDDIVQEAVTVMWKQFDEFEPGTDFLAWAFCITRNQIFKYIKQRQKHKRRFCLEAMQAIEEVIDHNPQKPDDRFDALRKCLTRLPEKDRQLLVLRYEVGATLKTVSQRIEQSVNTLYSRLYKIRITLLNCIERTLQDNS